MARSLPSRSSQLSGGDRSQIHTRNTKPKYTVKPVVYKKVHCESTERSDPFRGSGSNSPSKPGGEGGVNETSRQRRGRDRGRTVSHKASGRRLRPVWVARQQPGAIEPQDCFRGTRRRGCPAAHRPQTCRPQTSVGTEDLGQ